MLTHRLLYVVNNPSYFVAHWLRIAQAALRQGYDVHVACPPDESAETLRAQGVMVHPFSLDRGGLRPSREARACAQVFGLVRGIKPALLHNITIKAVVYGGLAARRLGVPALVSTLPGLGYLFATHTVPTVLLRGAIKRLYRYIFGHPNSRAVFQNMDDLQEFVAQKVVRASNATIIRGAGVDTGLFAPQGEPTGVPLIVLASRMLWYKGAEDFVQAAEGLRREGVQARFVLVGESDPGSRSAIPDSQLRRWHDSGTVEWWGQRNDMPRVLAQSSVVCLPTTYREGTPQVLTEAAACARPIVAFDVPGCREIVRNGENGILVPVRDVERLQEALRILIENPQLRTAMGNRGRALAVEEFSLDRVISQTLAMYNTLIARDDAGVEGRSHIAPGRGA
jgi:glycosyltransferase involved in cell wall biosynthesis